MAVRVLLPNAFQKHTNNVREISSTASNLPELVTDIEGRFPALRQHLRGEMGRFAGLSTSMSMKKTSDSWATINITSRRVMRFW